MLDIEKVNLEELASALEDHSDLGSWWIHPQTGRLEEWSSDPIDEDDDEESPAERGFRRVEPLASSEAYRDLAEFTERVRDRRARELLERSIAGRGAFRRFKDTLVEFPDLRQAWFAFHDARMRRRAIEWLAETGLVSWDIAERASASHSDPDLPQLGTPFDADDTARSVAADLARLFGKRLRRVVLFGSHARGDADAESDLDLAVVLDAVPDPWRELERMDDVLWRHSVSSGVVVSAVPVGERDFENPVAPAMIRARAEGRSVT